METSFKQYWNELLTIPGASLILWISALVIGLWVAYYFAKLFRDMAMGGSPDPPSYIGDFERLREEGKLDDDEYSRLKKSIPKHLPEKLIGKKNDN